MTIILAILKVVIIMVLVWLAMGVLIWGEVYQRAMKNRPIGYKSGMVIDKDGRLRGTKTPIYKDHKTGITVLGATEYE